MASLRFDSPLNEYLKQGVDSTIRKEIAGILNKEATV